MAAISLSMKRGSPGMSAPDFTIGVLAPNADDFEIRINTTDAGGAPMRRQDVRLFLQAIERALVSNTILPPGIG
ncbi:MAG: hypothetical protein L0Z50_40580 [Verrucomicrobiales bacterium]|nr:hypothetical protein [Verrucomicrobiales bacterium]